MLCFFSSWCCGWQWFFNADHCYWRFVFLMPWGCWAVFPSFGGFLLVLWGFCFLFSKCPLQLLLMVCVLCFALQVFFFFLFFFLLFFLFLFPFLPLLGFLFLWLSVFSVVSFLLPLPLAFPCAWFGRPLLTSFLLLFLFCPQLCGVGGGGGRAGGG